MNFLSLFSWPRIIINGGTTPVLASAPSLVSSLKDSEGCVLASAPSLVSSLKDSEGCVLASAPSLVPD